MGIISPSPPFAGSFSLRGSSSANDQQTLAISQLTTHPAMETPTETHRLGASEFFTNASETNIEQGHFSNVGRDQSNYTIYNVFHTREKKRKIVKDVEELSQFAEIKRGDIHKHKDVCYSWRLSSNGNEATEVAVFTAEINMAGSFGQRKFTVKSYRGQDATKEWRRDLARCSRDWNVPLFGYNKSSIPLLIFHGELVPLAHFEDRMGDVASFYIDLLRTTLGCVQHEVWMDPTKGTFCRGPVGPQCYKEYHDIEAIVIPSAVEFLAEDVLIRYLSSMHLSRRFLYALTLTGHLKKSESITTTDHSQVDSGFVTSAVPVRTHNARWITSPNTCLGSKKVMQDGTARFRLKGNHRQLKLRAVEIESTAWLVQASSVFRAHNISLDNDLSAYKLTFYDIHYKGALKKAKHKKRRHQLSPPVYLFARSSSSSLEDLSTAFSFSWSFSKTSQPPVSYDMCKYLGLPCKFSFEAKHHYQFSWPSQAYKAVYDYQLANGFDPTTTDFAQHLGYPVYNLVLPRENSRHQEVHKESSQDSNAMSVLSTYVQEDENGLSGAETLFGDSDGSLSLNSLFGDLQPDTELGSASMSTAPLTLPTHDDNVLIGQPGIRNSLWASLIPLFTWTICEDSDILTVAF